MSFTAIEAAFKDLQVQQEVFGERSMTLNTFLEGFGLAPADWELKEGKLM